MLIYTVQPGDSLWQIAAALASTVKLIIAANHLDSPFAIVPGQQLLVPVLGGSVVKVQPGDSLFRLARRFDLPVEVIAAANDLTAPFTILPGQELKIPFTLVPTGGCLAFLSSRAAGRQDIWARTPSKVGTTRLTFGLAGPASVPLWSPDGTRLAFVGRTGDLLVLDLATGQVRSLVGGLPDFTPLSWSPDSQSLLFALNQQIILIDAQTGATQPITAGDDPAFLPDGDTIVFTRQTGEFSEQVWQSKLDGSGLRQVTRLQDSGNIGSLTVDPRGELVAFTFPGASVSLVYIAELATGKLRATPQSEVGRDLFPVWSPSGDRLAYNSTIQAPNNNLQGRVRVVDRMGKLVGDLTDAACLGERLAWSPDSRSIAFPNCLSNLAQLSVVSMGSLPVQLTAHGINVHPSWRAADCPTN